MQKLLVGLGNPGDKYKNTRHNVGFWYIEQVAKKYNLVFSLNKNLKSYIAKWQFANTIRYLALPQTFMNESGQAVKAISSYFKIESSAITVIHDELDFPNGIVKIKNAGGASGHNGLKSIMQHLKTQSFNRCRIGIDHPGDKNKVLSYVLTTPSTEQKQAINSAIDRLISVTPNILCSDWQAVKLALHSTPKNTLTSEITNSITNNEN